MNVSTAFPLLRRLSLCLLPVLLGAGAALVLLLVAGGPAGRVYAGTFPACGASIQACIDAASPGDTIFIPAGDYTESLTLSKAVSLTGALSSTTILHALPNTRVLTVTGAAVDSSVVISGLTFTGGNLTDTTGCPAGCGGGVSITGGAQPSLSNLRLISNTAGYKGGGVFADGSLRLTGTQFVSNTAVYGSSGSGSFGGHGGGLSATGNVLLDGGSFVGNTAGGFGGVGGGVAAGGAATLTAVSFINNVAGDGFHKIGDGGGLYAAVAVVMTDAHFIHNFSSGWGGGLLTFGGVTAIGGSFISNTASSGNGGGLYAGGAAVVSGTQFVSNTADVNGGGMDTADRAFVTGAQFVSNKAGAGGGGLHVWSATMLAGTSFTNNIAGSGGGLAAGNSSNSYDGITLIGARFVGNSASSGSGGGLVTGGGAVTISGTEFISNTANFGQGGGVYFNANGSGSGRQSWLINDLFAGNRAGSQGDGLFGYFYPSYAVILHTTFADPGLAPGAAVYVAAGPVVISDSIIASYTVGISVPIGPVFQDYNLFFGNGTDVSGTVSSDGHSLTGSPLFVNSADNDYHLSAGSLAIDAGAAAGVATDFEGDPRPQGNGFDIGFDESPFIAVADVGLTKSANAGVRQPGETLTYTLDFRHDRRITFLFSAQDCAAGLYSSSAARRGPVAS